MSKANPINLALQGGGAQGAFTWGVLDQLLLDERLHIDAISATSAGAVNAVVMAYGMTTGGRDGARELLRSFWHKLSFAGQLLPTASNPYDHMFDARLNYSPSFMALDYLTRLFTPEQLNPLNINPLRDILAELIDFDALRHCRKVKLFINATNVRTGKIRVFDKHELTLDMVMASTCLPYIFPTVWVEGEPYWDGGYSGNPAIFPLVYNTDGRDILLVQINPLTIDKAPSSATEIIDRMNDISFNATLMREMRAIAFVHKLLKQGKVEANHYSDMLIHMIDSEDTMISYSRLSKLNTDWDFLSHLHSVGIEKAQRWLDANYAKVGQESSVDVAKVFL